MAAFPITNQKDLRAAFWADHPNLKRGVKRVGKDAKGRTAYVEK